MKNNFEELLAKSLKESKDYADKRKSTVPFKEVHVPEEEVFLNSLSPEDREAFEKMLIFDIGFVYYPGCYGNNSSSSSYDPDWNRRYYEDKRFFLQTLKEKELSQSVTGRKAG